VEITAGVVIICLPPLSIYFRKKPNQGPSQAVLLNTRDKPTTNSRFSRNSVIYDGKPKIPEMVYGGPLNEDYHDYISKSRPVLPKDKAEQTIEAIDEGQCDEIEPHCQTPNSKHSSHSARNSSSESVQRIICPPEWAHQHSNSDEKVRLEQDDLGKYQSIVQTTRVEQSFY
jgi:hypothetical protein